MSNPLISVVMSVKDCQEYVGESIKSILNQTYDNFEFLIIDDFSKDQTFKICNEFAKSDERIKLFKNDYAQGLTKSLNKLIETSEGEIIARQDGDDISLKYRFQVQLNKYLKDKNKVLTSRTYLLNQSNIFGKNKIKPKFSYFVPKKYIVKLKNPFVHGTLFINKRILKEVGCYDNEYYYSQDYKLFYELLVRGYKIHTFFEPLYLTRNKGNISTIYKSDQELYAKKVREFYQ